MHKELRNQQRSDSAPIDVWHKILFTSVGTIFLKIYNLIPNVAIDLPSTYIWWSKGSMETLKNMPGKNVVLLAGLLKKTEMNAQVNTRDINNKHVPLLALRWVGSHAHTDWGSHGLTKQQHQPKAREGSSSWGRTEEAKLACVCVFCVCVLVYLFCFFFKYHSPSTMSQIQTPSLGGSGPIF